MRTRTHGEFAVHELQIVPATLVMYRARTSLSWAMRCGDILIQACEAVFAQLLGPV